MADPQPPGGRAQVTAPPLLPDRIRICAAPASAAAMSTKAPAFPFAAAIAILVAAAPACIDRALPGGGTLQGSTAGASGVVASGTGGAGGAVTAGTGGGGGAVTAGTGTGGGGGSAIGCSHLDCPQIFCPWSRALDDRGCETCACAPGPGPGDCDEIICGPRPTAPKNCLDPEMTCAPHGDQCVWMTTCKPPPPCPATECGPLPLPELPPPPCHAGPVQPPACTRDSDATCRWHFLDCPLSCVTLATRATCDKVAGCQWLIRACGEPTIPATGCVEKGDILGCSSACTAPRKCTRVVVDSCTLPDFQSGASCDDAVCRDVGIAVCAWW